MAVNLNASFGADTEPQGRLSLKQNAQRWEKRGNFRPRSQATGRLLPLGFQDRPRKTPSILVRFKGKATRLCAFYSIEDDAMVGAGLSQALNDAGMSVDWSQDGIDGELAVEGGTYTLILLDLNLPGKPGLEILHDLRRRAVGTPVVVLTARDALEDRIEGLDLGADDYLVKPFEVSELLARIRAVLRRHRGHAVSTIGNGRVTLDLASREAAYEGTRVVLAAREFALLQALLEADRERS